MTRVVRDPNNPTVAYAGGYTVWRSVDAGSNWAPYGNPISHVQISGLAVGAPPTSPLFVASGSALYRPASGGTWQKVDEPADDVLIAPADRRQMLTVSADAHADSLTHVCAWVDVRRSEDGGATWRSAGRVDKSCTNDRDSVNLLTVPILLPHPTLPGTAWMAAEWLPTGVGSGLKLWRTDDHGRTWREETLPTGTLGVDLPPPYTDLVAWGLSPIAHRALDGGPWADGTGSCAAVAPEPFMFLASSLIGCSGSRAPTDNFSSVARPVGSEPTLGSSMLLGILRTGGTGWVRSSDGLTAEFITGAVRLHDGSTVISGGQGTYRQRSGGPWELWNDGLPSIGGEFASVQSLGVDGAGRAVVLSSGALLRRGDADSAWTALPVPAVGNPSSLTRAISPAQPVYLASDTGIAASDDGGTTWPRFQASTRVALVVPAPSEPRVAYATRHLSATFSEVELSVTRDGGGTWHKVGAGFRWLFGLTVDPRDASHLVAVEERGVVVSHDGGRTWSAQGGNTPASLLAFAFDRDAGGVIYAGTYWDGLWASADDGLTWGQVPGSATGAAISSFLDEPAPGSATVALRAASSWRLYATLGRVGGGLARIDVRVRLPKLVGTPHHNARRSGRTATCTGVSVVGGGPSLTLWKAGRTVIGKGRRFKVPASAVGRAVRCEFRADTPFANVFRATRAVTLVGRPFTPRPRIAGGKKVGSQASCRAAWRGKPVSTSFVWRVAGKMRGTGLHYTPSAADAGRGLSCTATARNRYGTYAVSSASVKIRR